MLEVPLTPVPSQRLTVTLGSKTCQLAVYQRATGLYMDVSLSNALIVAGVIGQNLNRIVRDAYLGFVGDFVFFDSQGSNDPDYTGLGARFRLIYLEPADLP